MDRLPVRISLGAVRLENAFERLRTEERSAHGQRSERNEEVRGTIVPATGAVGVHGVLVRAITEAYLRAAPAERQHENEIVSSNVSVMPQPPRYSGLL